ncbi:MAG: aminotransferase class I/II-fold pyridoxal phosphate-dependent enzyme [Acidimicrobiia bacterium]|nr:aminotransferase class I/II-fold pyridoxal phosphate-dependent enzyme [Acidimicrobiia bacterium]
MPAAWVPPPYPYDRLDAFREIADALPGGVVDLSIGTPYDPPPASVVAALGASDTERSYPASKGSQPLRDAAGRWMQRRFGIDVPADAIGASIGTKEFVAGLPGYLRLRAPDRDTILSPSVAYPSYSMGATLAGCRSVTVPPRPDGTLDLEAIDPLDADRALALWVNSPSNPTGELDDLEAAAGWGRAHDVPVFSDECYVEFTWSSRGRTILEHGVDGVVAVHSLSKRSNLAGLRVGFYAGDPELVAFLQLVRQHAGMMVPGPAQAAGVVALDDDVHVSEQRELYWGRLELLSGVLADWSGVPVPTPAGGFYLWIPVSDGWEFAERLARDGGAIVSPGEFYGDDGAGFVRVAVVQPDDRIALVAERLRGG